MSRRAGKFFRALLFTAMTVLIAVAFVIALFTATESGSRYLLSVLIDLSGEDVQIGAVEGTLTGGLEVRDVDYRSETLTLHLDHGRLRWRPLGLALGRLTFPEVQARGVELTVQSPPAEPAAPDEDEDDPAPVSWPPPLPPVGLAVVEGRLDDVTITRDGKPTRLQAVALSGRFDRNALVVNHLSVEHADFFVALDQGRIDNTSPHALRAGLNWRSGPAGAPRAAGSLIVWGELHNIEIKHTLEQPMQATTTGRAKLGDTPTLHLETIAEDQPLPAPADGRLNRGSLTVDGWLDGYSVTADVAVAASPIGNARVELQAAGDRQSADIDRLAAELLEGRLEGDGRLTWSPELTWSLDLRGRQLNPGRLWPQWQSRVSFKAATEGRYGDAGDYAVTVAPFTVEGTLRRHTLSGNGEIDLAPGKLTARRTELRVGENRLSLDGTVAEQSDLNWTLNADRLDTLWPELAGRLKGQGRFRGTLQQPALDGSLTGRELHYNDLSIGTVRLRASSQGGVTESITASAEQLAAREHSIERVDLAVSGRPDQHRLDVSAAAEAGRARLRFEDAAWQSLPAGVEWTARMTAATIDSPYSGEWRLQNPSRVTASNRDARLDNTCWQREQANVCGRAAWSLQDGVDISARLDALPLSTFHPYIPDASRLEGSVGGELTVNGPAGALQAGVQLRAPPGALVVTAADEEPERYPWRAITAQLDYDGATTRLSADADLGELGRFDGGLALAADDTVQGRLNVAIDDIGWLELFAPRLRDVDGALRGTIRVEGPSTRPRIDGKLTLSDGAAQIPAAGIALSDMQAEIRGDGERVLHIEASARSGEGEIRAGGKLALDTELRYRLTLAVGGEAFEAVDLPRVNALVQPDLDVEATPERLDIRGGVTLPVLDVTLKSMPASAVEVSPDARVVDGASTGDGAGGNLPPLRVEVTVQLGDQVRFRGFGLEARLAGAIDMTQAPGRPPRAYGEVRVVEGRYKAYGQNLRIETGKLIFQGPYDNPALDVRAIRKTPDVTAGLEITGTLKQPRSRVFSDPQLPESEALAVLLTGRPLSAASENDANMLINAIASLGIKRGEAITQQIARTFNLDEVRLEAGQGAEESSLLLGKYLSPRLYVRYAVGLFGRPGELGLEYKLNRNLKLEAISGEERSMDLIYEIER